MLYKEQIDLERIPRHVAIIMDGNGRWAKQRGHARTFGHQAGAETVHVIAEEAARLGVKFLTLYTFSTENWGRPVDEVAALMSLLMDSIEEETFMKNNILRLFMALSQGVQPRRIRPVRVSPRLKAVRQGQSLILAGMKTDFHPIPPALSPRHACSAPPPPHRATRMRQDVRQEPAAPSPLRPIRPKHAPHRFHPTIRRR